MNRPTVSVYNHQNEKEILREIRLPHVFLTPIRNDIVQFVYDNLQRNTRQAHGVDPRAGMKHSAESWGTGRAVARVPRVSGSGTNRNGQGAFANSCRKGRMAFPVHTWRKWHRKVNLKQRRHALASAIAASAVPGLVLAHGHRIMKVPQIPLVLDKEVNSITKTKDAVALLKRFGANEDVERVISTKRVKAGKTKVRNGRYKIRCGPLFVVTDEAANLTRALRNIPGVSVLNVNRLNIRHLAPGSQVGRFCIFTEEAFRILERVFGSFKQSGEKKGYLLHRDVLSNADISHLINSDSIQKALRPKKIVKKTHALQKKNPLRNKSMMHKLNPYSTIIRKMNKERSEKTEQTPKDSCRQTEEEISFITKRLDEQLLANHKEFKQLFKDTNL